jgi:hypothetical protein
LQTEAKELKRNSLKSASIGLTLKEQARVSYENRESIDGAKAS